MVKDYHAIRQNKNIKIFFSNTELKELYIANYMGNPSSSNYNFNKYLKRLKKLVMIQFLIDL